MQDILHADTTNLPCTCHTFNAHALFPSALCQQSKRLVRERLQLAESVHALQQHVILAARERRRYAHRLRSLSTYLLRYWLSLVQSSAMAPYLFALPADRTGQNAFTISVAMADGVQPQPMSTL